MARTSNIYANDGLFVGLGHTDASLFLDISGNPTNGPVKFWKEVGVSDRPYTASNGTLTSGVNNIFGKNNVNQFVINSANSLHSLAISQILVNTGKQYIQEIEVLIPSSNSIVNSIDLFTQSNPYVMARISGFDKWQTIAGLGVLNTAGNSTMYATFAGNPDFTAYIGNGTDSIYFKNWIIALNSGETHINTIQQLNRIQSVNISVPIQRNNLLSLGSTNIVNDKADKPSEIGLDFEYLLYNLKNESRLGLNVNFPSFFNGQSAQPYYSGYNYNIFNGFFNKSLSGIATGLNTGVKYPYIYQDKKSFYLNSAPQGKDLLDESIGAFEDYNTSTYALGGCYLKSYNVNASVGQFPVAKLNYVCDNINYDLNNKGAYPTLNPVTKAYSTGRYYILPVFSGEYVSTAINPGDITVNITNSNYGAQNAIQDVGLDFSDIIIQGFDFSIQLDRDNVNSIGQGLVVDRPLKPPFLANLNIEGNIGDYQEGSLRGLIDNNYPFNVEINMAVLRCVYTGLDSYLTNPIKYSFIGAQLTDIKTSMSIQNRKTFNLSFQQEIDPDVTNYGLFLSGVVWNRRMNPINTGTFLNNNQVSVDFLYNSGANTFVRSFI